MEILYTIQLVISWIIIIAVVLPFVKSDYWVFKILEYPRYQKFILCAILFVGLLLTNDYTDNFSVITLALLGLCMLYLTYKIWPYTPLSKKEMQYLKNGDISNQLKLFTANVFQENKAYDKLISQVKKENPDIILLVETDKNWEKAMDIFIKDYPHCLKEPKDNTYGMLFYSRFPIVDGRFEFLVDKEVPSLLVKLQLPSGQHVRLWGLHPKPPVPQEDIRSTAKDKELMKVALKVKDEKLPAIVLGDLNDVAWSHVTKLFRKTSGLLDPRRGRGFYSTFSANHWYMRFPLDYVFCSSDFGLVDMKRLKYNGSDHFPMFMHLQFHAEMENKQEEPESDTEEKAEAEEIATQIV
ncbi:MAG: endonuclease/exonuclease/phosphatase family protein [Chitinophagaceae bacterium]|jgi:endonuclease/exonuclease/phosphatase (EEP) superfamily protein YafD|nr:endonuclease/exonuclease/phosphatase family protein [Chitinophagaceae bacterium]